MRETGRIKRGGWAEGGVGGRAYAGEPVDVLTCDKGLNASPPVHVQPAMRDAWTGKRRGCLRDVSDEGRQHSSAESLGKPRRGQHGVHEAADNTHS